jgi:hypothetical protein
VRLCHDLLDDAQLRVRHAIRWHLMRFGDRDDAVAEAKVRAAAGVPALRARALLALGTVGTPTAFPWLYALCSAGEKYALVASARQARTMLQRQQALELSRRWLLSEEYAQRDEALRALHLLSTAAAETAPLLRAYLAYGDEWVVRARGGASAYLLPILHLLLARWPADSAEYGEVVRAIRRLESRLALGKHVACPQGRSAWSGYL